MMLSRSVQRLRFQDPRLSATEQRHALAGFAMLNRLGRVPAAIYGELAPHAYSLAGRPLRVLDLVSGSGDLAIALAVKARRNGLAIQITTVSPNEFVIATQRTAAKTLGIEIGTLKRDWMSESLPSGFDVVTCTHFDHRLDDQHFVRLLQSMQASAARCVIVCDWERSRLNLCLMGITSRVASRSPIVRHDTLLSIRGAYTQNEFTRLAQSALLRPMRSRRLLSSRFLVTIEDPIEMVTSPAFA